MVREPIGNADEAIAFLLGLVRDNPRSYQARAGLDALPVRALLERVGNPHSGLAVAHIAGSKGKGSTALYLEAILEAAGQRTGTFTSPHLQRWTERLRIDGRESMPTEFTAAIATLAPHVRDLLAECPESAPSFFDVLTAAAFVQFAEHRVDCAIMETGIGGTLDATNVCEPRVCCITSVELEHTDKLGRSIPEIARHKAGIIKPGVAVITGRLPAQAEDVIGERAAALGAPVHALGRDITLSVQPAPRARLWIGLPGQATLLDAPLDHDIPRCMAENIAISVACAEQLGNGDWSLLTRAVARALPTVRIPARMELLDARPWIVVDGAHTSDSIAALTEMLSSIPARHVHLLVSLSAEREAGALLAPLRGHTHRIVTTRADPLRSMDPRRLASALVDAGWPASRVQAIDDPHTAVTKCRAALGHRDLLCATGSMYMAGLARALLSSETSDRRAAP